MTRVEGVDSPFHQAEYKPVTQYLLESSVSVCAHKRDKEKDPEYLPMLVFKCVCVCLSSCVYFSIMHLLHYSPVASLTIAAVELKTCLLNKLFIQIPVPMLERALKEGSETEKPQRDDCFDDPQDGISQDHMMFSLFLLNCEVQTLTAKSDMTSSLHRILFR